LELQLYFYSILAEVNLVRETIT